MKRSQIGLSHRPMLPSLLYPPSFYYHDYNAVLRTRGGARYYFPRGLWINSFPYRARIRRFLFGSITNLNRRNFVFVDFRNSGFLVKASDETGVSLDALPFGIWDTLASPIFRWTRRGIAPGELLGGNHGQEIVWNLSKEGRALTRMQPKFIGFEITMKATLAARLSRCVYV